MKRQLSFERPLVMGILNVTPDSFSDGGQLKDSKMAVERSLQMLQEGADIIDIGGESTGPDSKDVSLEEELNRVIPVIKSLRAQTGAWISVDTYKAEVGRQAIEVGADMLNDVTALRGDAQMVEVLKKYDVPIVIMYAKDPSARTTRDPIQYKDVIQTIRQFLILRLEQAVKAGIARERFIIDPGMGAFVSSDPKYSFQILKRLKEFQDFGLPLLIGASRKGFLGGDVKERLEASLACAAVATMNGASILRVHDVQETRKVVDMVHQIKSS